MNIPWLSRRRDYVCEEFVEVVTEYLEGTLLPRDRKRFEKHFRLCDGCDQYLAQIRTVIELTGRLQTGDVDALGADARASLMGAFRAYRDQT